MHAEALAQLLLRAALPPHPGPDVPRLLQRSVTLRADLLEPPSAGLQRAPSPQPPRQRARILPPLPATPPPLRHAQRNWKLRGAAACAADTAPARARAAASAGAAATAGAGVGGRAAAAGAV